MRVVPKVFGLDILDNNIFHNLYISETYILYELYMVFHKKGPLLFFHSSLK